MSLSREPVLSVELFQTIIDILAEHPPSAHDEPHLARERSANLLECALVCKRFAQMCRPHIFEHVHYITFSGPKKHRLLSFIDHVTRNPNDLRLVRMLSVDTYTDSDDEEPRLTIDEDQFQRIISTLCSFPNLHFLDINEYEYYLGKPDNRKDIRLRLLRTYLQQGTLRTLHIDRLPQEISPGSVITTPGLICFKYRWHMDATIVVPSSDMFSDLKELLVTGGSQNFPIDFLDHCPHIKYLTLHDSLDFTGKSAMPAFDSSILKALTLWHVSVFHEFCQIRHRHHDGRKLYQDLEDLKLQLLNESSIVKAGDFLSDMPSLRTLNVHVFPDEPFFDLLDLGIDRLFTDGTFKNLVWLNLTYTALPGAEGYEKALSSMQSVIDNAAGCNVLEKIDVFLKFGRIPAQSILALGEPPFPALDRITAALGDKDSYPLLKVGVFGVMFELPLDTPDGKGYPWFSRIFIKDGVAMLDGMDRRSS